MLNILLIFAVCVSLCVFTHHALLITSVALSLVGSVCLKPSPQIIRSSKLDSKASLFTEKEKKLFKFCSAHHGPLLLFTLLHKPLLHVPCTEKLKILCWLFNHCKIAKSICLYYITVIITYYSLQIHYNLISLSSFSTLLQPSLSFLSALS